MTGGHKTVDEYLVTVGGEKRVALQKLRRHIRAAVPRAEECIAYGVPAFRLDGRFLLAFGAAAGHCSFYPGSTAIAVHADELEGYDTGKGTIRFQAGRPLPALLVRKLVQARIAASGRKRGKASADRGRARRPSRTRRTGSKQVRRAR